MVNEKLNDEMSRVVQWFSDLRSGIFSANNARKRNMKTNTRITSYQINQFDKCREVVNKIT